MTRRQSQPERGTGVSHSRNTRSASLGSMSASTGPAAPSLRDLREYPEGTVYVVHLDPLYRHARHYSGNPESSAAFAKASRLLNVAGQADLSRAGLWAEGAGRVHAAARAQAGEVAGPGDPRPLAEIVPARLEAAGIAADAPALRFVVAWNAQRYAVAKEPQPGHEAQHELAVEPLSELEDGAQREAGQ